jgi:hypothetical protein
MFAAENLSSIRHRNHILKVVLPFKQGALALGNTAIHSSEILGTPFLQVDTRGYYHFCVKSQGYPCAVAYRWR